MLAIPAAVPPIPATDPTSCFGKQSDGVVCRLVIQLWNPHAIKPIPTSASASDFVSTTSETPIGASNELATMTVRRALSTDHPLRINRLDVAPPVSVPISAKRKGIQASIPISAIEN